jgi:hypothetical protein
LDIHISSQVGERIRLNESNDGEVGVLLPDGNNGVNVLGFVCVDSLSNKLEPINQFTPLTAVQALSEQVISPLDAAAAQSLLGTS